MINYSMHLNNKIKTCISSPGFLIALAIIIFLSGCGENKEASESASAKKNIPRVKAVKVAPSFISKTIELTGSVVPYRVAALSSPAEGPVAGLRVREGDRVSAGEVLLTIGRKMGVEASIVSLREELKKEEDNLKRVRQLVESEAIPSEQLDQAKAAYEKVLALLVKAEETANDYIITAPWPGVVSSVNVKDGQFVSPRTALLEIYDPASMVINTEVPEDYSTEIIRGIAVEVRLDAYPGKIFNGKIERVYPYLDSQMRTRRVEVNIEKSVNLLPGMFARLKAMLETFEDAITVPSEALINTKKGITAFVIEDNKAVSRIVSTGIESGNSVQILSGIKAGDSVIVSGNDKLKEGMEVGLIKDEKTGDKKAQELSDMPMKKTGEGDEDK